jgi:two-component system nitrogen regulation sensor histidine kinase NtrY
MSAPDSPALAGAARPAEVARDAAGRGAPASEPLRSEPRSRDDFSGAADLRPQHLAIYGVASVATILALYLSVSGADVLGPASLWVGALLAVNVLAILYLAAAVAKRIAGLVKAGRGAAIGARLHLRFVSLFALAAVVPAIVIASFSAITIGQGVQAWFTDQVRGGFEATRVLGRQSINKASEAVQADIVAMAADLNAAADNLVRAPATYRAYLAGQADRRGFVAAYVIDSRGSIIQSAQRPDNVPSYVAPDADDLAVALGGDVSIEIDENVVVRALFKLDAYRDAYLFAVRLPEAGQPELLRQAEGAVRAFQTIEQRQGWLQWLIGAAYLETVLLVLIGAAWLGLATASRISGPIGRLATAAERVREGDLDARVETGPDDDEIAGLTKTFNLMTGDLRAQRQAIESARESAVTRSAFIRAVLEGVSAGVVSLNADGVITAANASAARLLEVDAAELEGRALIDMAPQFADIIARAKPNQPANGQIDRLAGPDTRVLDVRAAYAGGDLVVTFDDVSSLLAAQRQAAWRDVARRIAHEIKNPLTPIQLSAERLRRKYAPQIEGDRDAFLRMTDTIVRQVGDIGRMVDEFAAFARMPAPRFAVDDLGETVRQAVFAQRIATPDIEIMIQTPPEPVPVSMDARLIAQALANLLKNAAEAIGARRAAHGPDAAGEIGGALVMADGLARLDVVDDGAGFPAQDRRRLLEPYMTTRAKGTGLGLAIVARVLEEHGGGLELADRDDGARGACVRVRLPLAETARPADPTSTTTDPPGAGDAPALMETDHGS